MLRVSVVIPTYNRTKFLTETLSAVLAQTLPPHEVIVVDDGSTDDTQCVLRRFPVTVLSQSNRGPNAARAQGAAAASGDWLVFCDDDDLWQPNFLAVMAERMPAGANLAFANFVHVRHGVWGRHDKFSDAPEGFFEALDQPLYPKLLRWFPLQPSNTLIRREHFLAIGGIDLGYGRAMSEDFELALRCTQSGPALAVPEVLVGIRRHGENMTNNRLGMTIGHLHALRWAKRHHRLATRYGDIMDDLIARSTVGACHLAFVEGRMALVRELAAQIPLEKMTLKLRTKIVLAHSRLPGPIARAMTAR